MMRGLLTLATAVTLGASAANAWAAEGLPFDLTGDGRQELVVGVPLWKHVSGARGGVAVVRGTRRKLLGKPVLLRRHSVGISRTDWDPYCGRTVASGDFDGDGIADLAFGCPYGGEPDPGESLGNGTVVVVYGSRGFPGERHQVLGPLREGENPSAGDTLVAGDLNGDGFSDLVSGGRGDRRVDLFYGGADGLPASGGRGLPQPADAPGVFGLTLAVGDGNDDGYPDLFEAYDGEPVRDEGTRSKPGHVTTALGGPGGPADPVSVDARVAGGPVSLGVGDVDGDGYDDLVGGTPVERFFDILAGERSRYAPAGGVKIWLGGPDGPADDPILITQETRGIPGHDQAGDEFGASVAVGRLDRDRYADIVVGAPGEDKGGRVTIIRGGPSGHAKEGHRRFHLDTPGVPGHRSDETSGFGERVALLDLNGDGRLEIAVGETQRDGGRKDSVTVLRSSKRHLFTTKGAKSFRITSLGLRGGVDKVLGRPGSS